MAKTRRSHTSRKSHKSRKVGKKMSKWTSFVKKIYGEMKRKDANVKLGAAMKEASRRKAEM